MYHVLLVHWLHNKNLNAILKYNMIVTRVNDIRECKDLSIFDVVFSPSSIIDVSKYPNVKFIFGPHICMYPKEEFNMIKTPNTIYVQPSQWVIDWWNSYPICKDLCMKTLPFGVDTDVFCPNPLINTDKTNVFVYFKRRNQKELGFVCNFLNYNRIPYKIFNYVEGYNEKEYLSYLQSCKYGIWIDAHESQGFALEEALSCNVPLLVWNVSLFSQEENSNYPDIPATTIPYWSDSCGEVFYQGDEFIGTFQLFLSRIDTYTPRDYIVNNLSLSKCEEKFVELITILKNK
jgi:glycosyltransferase involved in cell wall biosynthesis